MRWSTCHECYLEEDAIREDKSIVRIYECHCCWDDYCEKHGYLKTRICNQCLDEAYKQNRMKE